MRIAEPAKKALQGAVQGSFELLWSACFALAGRFLRPRADPWSAASGRRAVVVAPHPDDEVAGCAGAILRHGASGDPVTVACVTDGRRSRAYGLTPDEMARTRRDEARAAAVALAVDQLEWLGLPEAAWRPEELTARLRELLDRLDPAVVYAPSRIDFHFEHEQVARALAAALDGSRSSPAVRVYAVQVPLGPSLANLILPLTGVAGEVRAALLCYRSQVGTLLRCLRHRRYLGRLYGAGEPVEEFWQMTAADYGLLHRQAPARALVRTFRGLRYYAWSDPLAYLRGRRERRLNSGRLRRPDRRREAGPASR